MNNCATVALLIFSLALVASSVQNKRNIETDSYVIKLGVNEDPEMLAADHKLKYLGQVSEYLPQWHIFEPVEDLKRDLEWKSNLETKVSNDKRVSTWGRNDLKRYFHRAAFADPLFSEQWHLQNTGQLDSCTPGIDINGMEAWDMGYTGNGVLLQFVDDGLQYDHPDFTGKYVSSASGDSDPYPENGDDHGTSCAGVAAAATNTKCGIGSAYKAKVASIRLIVGDINDAQMAGSVTTYTIGTGVAISSNSWGAPDDGITYSTAGTVFEEARVTATQQARNGKGLVFFWAAGNGALDGDSCSLDETNSSPTLITVGAVNSQGVKSSYSEECANVFVSAPSDDFTTQGIRTTTINSDCTSDFGGTSSATPLAAGVAALMLEANPSLTYRDVMYILAETSTRLNPDDGSWSQNNAGYYHSYKYGFGMVNAGNAVKQALNWTNVGLLGTYASPVSFPASSITYNNQVTSTIKVTSANLGGAGKTEHVTVTLDISHKYPNELEIYLVGPTGTSSLLQPVHNAGPVPKLSIDGDVPYLLRYTTFSPSVSGTLSASIIEMVFPDGSCVLRDINNNVLTSTSLTNTFAMIYYDASCDAGSLVSQAEDASAVGAFMYSNYRTIDGTSGSTIPSFYIPVEVGNELYSIMQNTGKTNSYTFSVTQGKMPLNGDLNLFRFVTVRHWGESSVGTWTLKVTDKISGDNGVLNSWNLEVYGTFPGTTNNASTFKISSLIFMLLLLAFLL